MFAGKRMQPACRTILGNHPHVPLVNVDLGSDKMLLSSGD